MKKYQINDLVREVHIEPVVKMIKSKSIKRNGSTKKLAWRTFRKFAEVSGVSQPVNSSPIKAGNYRIDCLTQLPCFKNF